VGGGGGVWFGGGGGGGGDGPGGGGGVEGSSSVSLGGRPSAASLTRLLKRTRNIGLTRYQPSQAFRNQGKKPPSGKAEREATVDQAVGRDI